MSHVQYAKSKDVHSALKKLLGSVFVALGWKRRPGATCAFVRQEARHCWCLWVQISQFGDSVSGNVFTLNLVRQAESISPLCTQSTSPLCGDKDARILRTLSVADRGICLQIASEIASRIPVPEPDHQWREWARQPGEAGARLQTIINNLQTPDTTKWEPDYDVWLNYYSVEDLTKWVNFLTPRLDHLLQQAHRD